MASLSRTCETRTHCQLALPCSQKMEAHLHNVSLVLCNDKASSFGAPDVLQACIDHMNAVHTFEVMCVGQGLLVGYEWD